ncbi:MAG: hypothetical protein C0613_15285 [Desulfobulbaceae bacterium]|nr:MAG: hypothetical protein C0613_15285 [Desulfobulbaceae bacterium]
MRLQELLTKKREYLLGCWEDIILGEYQKQTFRIFKQQKDQFANPVGHKIRVGLAELYDVLVDESDEEVDTPALKDLLKVRAVQPISASAAVAFVFDLKPLVEDLCKKEGMDSLYKEFLAFCARVDAAALAMFDIFSTCRHKVYQIRLNELKTGRHIITDSTKCSSQVMREDMADSIRNRTTTTKPNEER